MPMVPRCPTCRKLHRLDSVKPGTMVTCDSCQEVFDAYESMAEGPSGPEPKPAKSGAAAKSATTAKAKLDGTPKAKPKVRSEPDDDPPRSEPRRSRRSRRHEEPSSSGTGIIMILMAICIAGFLLVGLIGAAFWYASQRREEVAKERANAAEWEAENARRAAEQERVRLEMDLAATREQAKFDRERELGPGKGPTDNPGQFSEPPKPPYDLTAPPFPPRQPATGPADPPQQPKPKLSGVPKFEEPANEFKAGAQTELRALASVNLPALPGPPKNDRPDFRRPTMDYYRITHCPRHQLLFAMTPKSVWVYDLKEKKSLGAQDAKEVFTDMSLSSDQSALFVADYGGEQTGYGTPINPSRVHRFDMAARKWEERKAPKIAWKVEAVDAFRVLLLEQDQWVAVTLNKWEEDGVGVRELARIGSDYNGDIEYDPRTGRIYHGNRGISSPRISVRAVDGDSLKSLGDTGSYGSASTGGGGGSVVLSQDGTRLYYGALQVNAAEVGKNLEKFPEVIVAASRDIAFGSKAYYRATTGSKLGEFEFKTTSDDPKRPFPLGTPAVVSVSCDGMSVWVIDRDKNVARQFVLEGEK